MGLIARHLEAAGIPTVCLSSALDITRAVNPPRAAFLDFPLGHTAGKPFAPGLNEQIVMDALGLAVNAAAPGRVVPLPYHWGADDTWKDDVMRGDVSGSGDDRVPRRDTPQYQSAGDAEAAAATLAAGGCASCIWL